MDTKGCWVLETGEEVKRLSHLVWQDVVGIGSKSERLMLQQEWPYM